MSYSVRAKNILKDAIKSAIYIDENARSFYQDEASLTGAIEEELSIQLYNNFKKDGISLDVHKYVIGDERNSETLSFFTDNRDLVILDWKLDDQSGEEMALAILAEIIKAEHIHFCTIYTSEDQLDIVLKNILSYFSSATQEFYTEIKEQLELEQLSQEVIDIINETNLRRFDNDTTSKNNTKLSTIDNTLLPKLKKNTGASDVVTAITLSSISLSNTYKSISTQPKPSYINPEKKIVVINNTIVTILSKKDNTAEDLLMNYQNHIINDVDSFNQLLGIELYNNIAKTGSIISHGFVTFSKNALLHHRKKLKEDNLGHLFGSFMDEVFQERISLSLRDSKSLLLDNEFLDNEQYDKPDDDEIRKINVFYNSLKLNKQHKILNFGDVFQIDGEESRYLICITPLCDCLRPQEKIKSNFYFAEGVVINKKDALNIGDTSFISYLPNNEIVVWGRLNTEKDAKYNLLYIKPHQYKVFENKNIIDEENKIVVHYLNRLGETKCKTLIYQTTIRENYTQRIANHAFMYPMRVGIDFVKL